MKSSRSTDRLEQAMDVFWERGYYDTSMSELMGRTGLHRAAVYGAFGSKRRLYEATLLRYRDTVVAAFWAPLARPDAALADIERFFRGLHQGAATPGKRLGCLMVNASSEVSPHIRSVARIVSTFLGDLHALLHRACVNARTRGELRSGVDEDQVADYRLGSVLGLWALARSPAPATALRHYVDGVLGVLNGLRPEATKRKPSRSRSIVPQAQFE